MKLDFATEVFGGGPGSGCSGPNCGRPKGGAMVGTFSDGEKKLLRSTAAGIYSEIGADINIETLSDREVLDIISDRLGDEVKDKGLREKVYQASDKEIKAIVREAIFGKGFGK